MSNQKNVLGEPLESCATNPVTGFTRNGLCEAHQADPGSHTICVQVTREFLVFSKAQGNDLSTPMPQFEFPGLRPGDRWCLVALRWQEALEADAAPRVALRATAAEALEFVKLADLKKLAIDLS